MKHQERWEIINSEPYERLSSWISDRLAQGFSEQEIIDALTDKGWSTDDVKTILSDLKPQTNAEDSSDSSSEKAVNKTKKETSDETKSGDSNDSSSEKAVNKTKKETSDETKSEVSREDNTFSAEEFKELEKSEKKGFFKKLFFKDDEKEQTPEKEDEIPVETLTKKQLSIRMNRIQQKLDDEYITESKLEGRVESLNEKVGSLGDQLRATTEKIGELRSTVLGRERMYNKLEDDFGQIKYIVNAFKPGTLDKRFDEMESKVLKHDSNIEKVSHRLDSLKEKISEYLEIMSSIKDYQSVLEQLKKIKEVESDIRKHRLEMEKTASRTEILYHNLDEAVGKVNSTHDMTSANKEQVKDLIISLNKLETKVELLVKKEDFESLKNDVNIIKNHLFNKQFSK